MTERAQNFMKTVWEARNNGADTESKLVAAILSISAETVKFYFAQNDLIVLDKTDLLELSNEIQNLPKKEND
jgi:hypothetical protein